MIQPYKRLRQIVISVAFWFLLTKPKETVVFLHDKSKMVNERVESLFEKNQKPPEDEISTKNGKIIRTPFGDIYVTVEPLKLDLDPKDAYQYVKKKVKNNIDRDKPKKSRDTKLIESITSDCGLVEGYYDNLEGYYDNLENWEDF